MPVVVHPARVERRHALTLALLLTLTSPAALAQHAPLTPPPAAPLSVPPPLVLTSADPTGVTLRIPLRLPAGASRLVVAVTLPSGASYVPGSATLGDQPTDEPLHGPSGRLYWRLERAAAVLTLRAAPTTTGRTPPVALSAEYPDGRRLTLTGTFDDRDYAAARPGTLPPLTGGPSVSASVTLDQGSSDGVTPLLLRVTLTDATGQPSSAPFATVQFTGESLTPDADLTTPGHQIRLTAGSGTLALPPVTTPGPLSVTVTAGSRPHTFTVTVPTPSVPASTGAASLTLGLTPPEVLNAAANLDFSAPLAGGKLHVDASTQGALTYTSGVSAEYTRGPWTVAAGNVHSGIDAVQTGDVFGVRIERAGPVDLTAFAATVPHTARDLTFPGAGREYRLPGPVSRGSETVRIDTTHVDGTVTTRTLTGPADYTITASGVLTLTEPLTTTDPHGQPQHLHVTYAPSEDGSDRSAAWGVQASRTQGPTTLSAAATFRSDEAPIFAVRATTSTPTARADTHLTYASGTQLRADAYLTRPGTGRVSLRYQDATYSGPGQLTPGLNADATYQTPLAGPFGVKFDARARLDDDRQGASAGAQLTADLNPVTLGAGVRLGVGSEAALSVLGSGQLRLGADTRIDVTHAQPLLGGTPVTDASVRVPLLKQLNLDLRYQQRWGQGANAELAVSAGTASAGASAALTLPENGPGRARLSAQRVMPLSDAAQLSVRGSAAVRLPDGTRELSAGTSLDLRGSGGSFSAAADGTYTGSTFGVTVTSGGSWTQGPLTASAEGTYTFGSVTGAHASAALTYQTPGTGAFASVRYRSADTTPNGVADLTVRAAALARRGTTTWRAAAAVTTPAFDLQRATVEATGGATVLITPKFGLGAQAGATWTPTLGLVTPVLGLEGSAQVLPGLWVTPGWNVLGGTGTLGRTGPYMRFDVLLGR